jgi:cell division protease FtsH
MRLSLSSTRGFLVDARDGLGSGVRGARRSIKAWHKQWRRARVAKRKVRSRQVYALAASLVVLTGVFAWSLADLSPSPTGEKLTITQLNKLAAQHAVRSATFRDEDAQIAGVFACGGNSPVACPERTVRNVAFEPKLLPGPDGNTAWAHFWVTYPRSDAATAGLMTLLSSSDAAVSVDSQPGKAALRIIATFLLPLLMLANVFVLLLSSGKGGGAGIGEVETFGSIGKGRFNRRKKVPVTFADIAGADEAIEELKEVRDYLANPERYKEIGAQPPKGVLLVGPPGCGKTLLAKAVAGEVGVPFFSVAGAEFVESLVGVGAARVRDLFRRVRAVAPAVVFIDELDAAGRKRASGGGSGGNEEREQTLNQMLVEMDGFDVSSGIVVMGATNRPDILDPALLRPGRFDRHVVVDRPDLVGRIRILELHAKGKPFSHEVDFGYIARRTPGFSGADLANVINESALLSVRQLKPVIETPELEEAIQRTLNGTVRRGRMLTPEERKRASFHECGHVIAAAALGRYDTIHRVSILGAGRNVAATRINGDEELALMTRSQLRNRLVIHLAGLAAEEMVFGEPSTGSERDLEEATDLARDMVARYGMSDKIGRPRLMAKAADGFLDADIPMAAVSGSTHQDVENEVRRLLDEAERDAAQLLLTHRVTLDNLAAKLEVEETIEGTELEALLAMVRPEVELFGSLINSNGHVPAGAGIGGTN